MKELPSYLALVDSFSKLPGVGKKSAERMAYAVMEMRKEDAKQFSKAIEDVVNNVHKCPNCGLYEEGDNCEVCSDKERDHSTCIVVSYPKDALPFERLKDYRGVYHVLNGVISPSKGIGPEDLEIDALLRRIKEESIKEVILAMNPNIEGETTSLFLAKYLQKQGVSTTRLAYGLPMGASLDYADSLTLAKALEGRRKL